MNIFITENHNFDNLIVFNDEFNNFIKIMIMKMTFDIYLIYM